MKNPKISIVLPNLNHLKWLPERVDSILNQSFTDWECVVIDGESSDGSWDFFMDLASKDIRFKIHQFPAKGVYNAWNKGIKLCLGEYIYIATSDDTMAPDCLDKMYEGFVSEPRSGMVHCNLSIIDENSLPVKGTSWYDFPAQKYFGENVFKKHLRIAPLSGLLYATHQTIIHSFTQVLIKKEVFEKYGYFLENYGPQADLEWGLRASLQVNMLHIPYELATWRMHQEQLTTNISGLDTKEKIRTLMLVGLSNILDKKLKKSISTNFIRWTEWQILQKISFKERLGKKYYYSFRIKMFFNKEFRAALRSKESYHLYLQGKVAYLKLEKFVVEVN